MDPKKFIEKVEKRKAELLAAYEAPDGMTPAEADAAMQKIVAKAKSDVKQAERDEALASLIKLAKAVASDDPEIMEACTLLERKARAERASGASVPRGPSAPRVSRYTVLETEFPEVGATANENDLFAKYKMGRKDLYWLIADAIKIAKDVSLRKWISFNPETGVYTFEAIGENPPDGWTGYRPLAMKPAKAEEPVASSEEQTF